MLIVRPSLPQDLEALTALLRLLCTLEEDFSFNEEKQRRGLAMLMDNDRGRILVAEEDGKVIGMCTGQLLISTAEGGPSVLVEDMVVDSNHRGGGIGRALMQAMAGWAREQGATRLQLLADKNNPPALAFYERLGWRSTALICLRQPLSLDT